MDNLTRALAYLEKLDPAVSGSGGHNQTLRVACECIRFGLTDGEAWQALQWFNDNRCSPKWKEHELRHKLADAQRIAGAQRAAKVGGPAHGQRQHRTFTKPAPVVRPAADTRPVIERSAQEEELWWARVAKERGVPLSAWDEVEAKDDSDVL